MTEATEHALQHNIKSKKKKDFKSHGNQKHLHANIMEGTGGGGTWGTQEVIPVSLLLWRPQRTQAEVNLPVGTMVRSLDRGTSRDGRVSGRTNWGEPQMSLTWFPA